MVEKGENSRSIRERARVNPCFNKSDHVTGSFLSLSLTAMVGRTAAERIQREINPLDEDGAYGANLFSLSVFPEIKELSLIQGPVEPHHQRPQKAVTQRRRTREHHHCCLSPIALFSVVFRSTVSPKARLTSFPTSEPFKGAWTSDKAERKQLSASTRPDTATKCDIDET